MSDVFDSAANAAATAGGSKIRENGDFLVRVDRHAKRESRNPKTPGLVCVVEFSILRGTEMNPVGARRSFTMNLSSVMGPGNLKAYSCALFDQPEDGITADMMRAAFSDRQLGVGTVLRLSTTHTLPASGFDYWIHKWESATDAERALGSSVPSASPAPAPAAAPEPQAPAPPPAPVPGAAEARTKEEWDAYVGKGTPHPTSKGWEYAVKHPEWGCRLVK